MIRILHVLGGLERGGAETMVMNLYRNIDRTQVQFDFIIHTEEHQAYYDEIKSMGGMIYSFPRFTVMNLKSIKRQWNKFFLDHPEYVVLHSHVRSYATIFIPIAKKHGLKTIIHSHSTSNGKGYKAIVKKILQFPLRWQADYFFACSNNSGKWLFGKKIVGNNRFYCLKNAINTDLYRFNSDVRKYYKSQLNVENKLVFVHIGRFHPSKNHPFLIKVFYEIQKKYPDSVLLLVGDGVLRKEIENLIINYKLTDKVQLLGFRDDIPSILQASDYLLFPSKWEGLPVTVVEAQSAGLRCLVSDRITKEVCLTDLVKYLSIDDGYEQWVNSIEVNYIREDVTEKIKEFGYDIKDTANWLEMFYRRMINE